MSKIPFIAIPLIVLTFYWFIGTPFTIGLHSLVATVFTITLTGLYGFIYNIENKG